MLDVNLADGLVFPVADKLTSLNVPFVFFTASDDVEWPERFRATPKFQKPVSWRYIKTALLKPHPRLLERAHDRSFRRELDVSLPHLRVLARQLTGTPLAADDLVESKIRIGARPRDITVHCWLAELMIDISMAGSVTLN